MKISIGRSVIVAGLALLGVGMQLSCQSAQAQREDSAGPAAAEQAAAEPAEPKEARDRPTLVLTEAQWREVKTHLLDNEPSPQYPVGANFGDKIELIGLDVEGPLVAGEEATFIWYWRALADIEGDWRVFGHFDSSADPFRKNLDHLPLQGLYPTSLWRKGQIIEDVQEVTLQSNYPAGEAVLYIGLYRGSERLPIENNVPKTADRRAIGPSFTVQKPSGPSRSGGQRAKLPTIQVPSVGVRTAGTIVVDGKLDEKAWSQVGPQNLEPFGAAPHLQSEVYVVRTRHHLIIGARLPDEHVWSTKTQRDGDIWQEEIFNVFIDPDRDGKEYLELQINPLGTILDARFDERLGRGQGTRREQIDRALQWDMQGLVSAVHVAGTVNDDSDQDDYWSVEIQIPLQQIPGASSLPDAGDIWAANFYRYDRPTPNRTNAYAWSKPNGGSFHQVEQFGKLEFTAAKDGEVNSSPQLERRASTWQVPRSFL